MFASTIITTLSGILLRTPRAPSAADAHAAIYGDPHPVGVSISFGRIGCMFLLGENNKVVSTFPVDKPSISVGGLSTCDIRLYFMNVLRVEATIYFNFDTHSAHFFPMKASYTLNGVKVRGRSVGTSFALEDGDILRIGKRNFMWKYAEGKDDLTQAVFDSKPAVRGFRMSILPVATLLPKDPNKQQTVPLPTLPDMISAQFTPGPGRRRSRRLSRGPVSFMHSTPAAASSRNQADNADDSNVSMGSLTSFGEGEFSLFFGLTQDRDHFIAIEEVEEAKEPKDMTEDDPNKDIFRARVVRNLSRQVAIPHIRTHIHSQGFQTPQFPARNCHLMAPNTVAGPARIRTDSPLLPLANSPSIPQRQPRIEALRAEEHPEPPAPETAVQNGAMMLDTPLAQGSSAVRGPCTKPPSAGPSQSTESPTKETEAPKTPTKKEKQVPLLKTVILNSIRKNMLREQEEEEQRARETNQMNDYAWRCYQLGQHIDMDERQVAYVNTMKRKQHEESERLYQEQLEQQEKIQAEAEMLATQVRYQHVPPQTPQPYVPILTGQYAPPTDPRFLFRGPVSTGMEIYDDWGNRSGTWTAEAGFLPLRPALSMPPPAMPEYVTSTPANYNVQGDENVNVDQEESLFLSPGSPMQIDPPGWQALQIPLVFDPETNCWVEMSIDPELLAEDDRLTTAPPLEIMPPTEPYALEQFQELLQVNWALWPDAAQAAWQAQYGGQWEHGKLEFECPPQIDPQVQPGGLFGPQIEHLQQSQMLSMADVDHQVIQESPFLDLANQDTLRHAAVPAPVQGINQDIGPILEAMKVNYDNWIEKAGPVAQQTAQQPPQMPQPSEPARPVPAAKAAARRAAEAKKAKRLASLKAQKAKRAIRPPRIPTEISALENSTGAEGANTGQIGQQTLEPKRSRSWSLRRSSPPASPAPNLLPLPVEASISAVPITVSTDNEHHHTPEFLPRLEAIADEANTTEDDIRQVGMWGADLERRFGEYAAVPTCPVTPAADFGTGVEDVAVSALAVAPSPSHEALASVPAETNLVPDISRILSAAEDLPAVTGIATVTPTEDGVLVIEAPAAQTVPTAAEQSSQPPAQTRLSLETANQTIIDDILGNAERIAQHPAQTTQQTEVVQFVMDTDIAPVSQEAAPTRARRSVKKTEKVRNTQLPETTEEARPIRPLRRSRGIAVAPTTLPEPAAPPSKTRSRTKPAVQAAVKPIEPDVPEEAKPALKRGRKTVAKEPQVEPVKTTRKRALPVEVEELELEAIAPEEPVRKTRARKTAAIVERGDIRQKPSKTAGRAKVTIAEESAPKRGRKTAAIAAPVEPVKVTRKRALPVEVEELELEAIAPEEPVRKTRSRKTAAVVEHGEDGPSSKQTISASIADAEEPAPMRGRKPVTRVAPVQPVRATRKRPLPVDDEEPEVEAIAELEEPVRQTRSRKTTSVVERGDNRPSPAKKARSSKMATTDEPLGPSQAKPKAATRKGAVAATASAFDKENSPAPIRMTRSRATRSAAAPEPAALAVRATRSRAARK